MVKKEQQLEAEIADLRRNVKGLFSEASFSMRRRMSASGLIVVVMSYPRSCSVASSALR